MITDGERRARGVDRRKRARNERIGAAVVCALNAIGHLPLILKLMAGISAAFWLGISLLGIVAKQLGYL